MKYKTEIQQLEKVPYFGMVTLSQMLNLTGQTLNTYATRVVERDEFVRLKKGIFVTSEYVKWENDQQSYGEFLANTLYSPSYLTGAYVLQKYSMISESVFAYTSITTLKTGKIFNKIGSFLYTSIKLEMFDGYEVVQRGRYQIRQATKAKALFDYLFFATKSWRGFDGESVEGLRLNLDEMSESDWKQFDEYIEKWGGRKMKKIRRLLCNQS